MTFNRPLGRFLFVFTLLLVMLGSTLISLRIRDNRDRRTWETCRRELEAAGERLDWREYVPPAVPDDQNFAMTPLLAPLQDCTIDTTGQLSPRNPNAVTRLRETFAWAGQMRGGDWQRMTFADVASWQKWFRSLTNEVDDGLGYNWVGPPNYSPSAYPQIVSLQFERDRRQLLRENASVAAWLATPPLASPADDVLALMNRSATDVNEVRAALRRPYARFNICYEQCDQFFDVQWPHLTALKKFALMFHDKATVELAANDTGAALDDILAGFDLADTLKDEPLFNSGQTRLSLVRIMIQPAWEGLARRQWTGEQIAALQARFEQLNLVESMAHALRGERSINLFIAESIGRRGLANDRWNQGDGWLYHEEATFARWFQQYVLPPYDTTNRVVDVGLAETLKSTFRRDHGSVPRDTGFAHSLVWELLFSPAVSRVANTQAAVNLAATACALERYRIARGHYPEQLGQLTPEFIKRIPSDPVNGRTLNYERSDPQHFQLYSVGLDCTDDEGSGERFHGHPLDWVWAYPSK